jgi:hypothetical protein
MLDLCRKHGICDATNEAFVADGYQNKRVAVLDADTGRMKRYWGAYGNKPDDSNLGPFNPDAPRRCDCARHRRPGPPAGRP